MQSHNPPGKKGESRKMWGRKMKSPGALGRYFSAPHFSAFSGLHFSSHGQFFFLKP
jgi:hypothetical protein